MNELEFISKNEPVCVDPDCNGEKHLAENHRTEMNVIEASAPPEPLVLPETPTEQDYVGQATQVFSILFPRFTAKLDALSNKSLKRVTRSLIGVPLEIPTHNLKRAEEIEVYLMGERLLEAKSVIVLDIMFRHQKELESLAAKPTEVVESAETVIEESKGE